jgi:hypothetical protein
MGYFMGLKMVAPFAMQEKMGGLFLLSFSFISMKIYLN